MIGHQWWWEYPYDHYDGRDARLHHGQRAARPGRATDGVPRPVYLTLKSADVCHSFWVPRLAGKTDLIPGRINTHVVPDRRARPVPRPVRRVLRHPARQHAAPRRRRLARATSSAGWRTSGSRPSTSPARAGRQAAFLAQSCVNCHRVRGTPAQGSYAPDLTHLMSRQTLASGMVAEHAREPAPLGGRPADRSSRAA